MKSVFNPVYNPGIKINIKSLFFLGCLCIGLIAIDSILTEQKSHPYSLKMIDAATKMFRTFALNKSLRDSLGLSVNSQTDPLNTGFIGEEFSPITTTIGNLDAKQTSTNPDFAALFIHWFDALELKSGDTVVIHASGSFPALSIAAIIACESAGLNPVIMSSVGASSFGANIPDLTYWDMENYLFRKGLIKRRTSYATFGGQNDNGSSFWEGGMEIAFEAAKRNNYSPDIPENLEEAIHQKLNFIRSFQQLKLFINIGGNQAAVGNNPCSINIPVGLINYRLDCNTQKPGLIHALNKRGIPVIHMLNIRDIALSNGISISPSVHIEPGKSGVYFVNFRPLWIPVLSLLLLFSFLLFISIRNKKMNTTKPPQLPKQF